MACSVRPGEGSGAEDGSARWAREAGLLELEGMGLAAVHRRIERAALRAQYLLDALRRAARDVRHLVAGRGGQGVKDDRAGVALADVDPVERERVEVEDKLSGAE